MYSPLNGSSPRGFGQPVEPGAGNPHKKDELQANIMEVLIGGGWRAQMAAHGQLLRMGLPSHEAHRLVYWSPLEPRLRIQAAVNAREGWS
jgi:hypothetical protein